MTFRLMINQSNFDSIFVPAAPGRPATLTIRLKVALAPLDAQAITDPQGITPTPTHLARSKADFRTGTVLDYNDRPFHCRSWLAVDWDAYKTRFKRAVEHAWNNQLIMLPTDSGDANDQLSDDDYRQLIGAPNVRAHVQGAIEIELVPLSAAGHALIEVVQLDDEKNPRDRHFRVWMNRISNESVQFHFHGHDDWPGWQTGQITAAHEVGHWLRGIDEDHFDHIDAEYAKTLPRAQRGKAQYGRTLGRKASLMGSGSLVTEHEARPWLTRMRRQSSMKLGWSMMHRIHFDRVKTQLTDRDKRLAGTI